MALNKRVQLSTHSEYSPARQCKIVNLLFLGDILFKLWWKIDLSAVYKVRAITIISPHSTFKENKIYIKKLDNDLDNKM